MSRHGRLSLAALLTALAACSSGSTTNNTGNHTPVHYPPDPGGTPAQSVNVDVSDDYFSPSSVVVAVGGTVTWHWVGGNGHSVTPQGSPTFNPQANVSYPPKDLVVTFPTAGTYHYYCTVHGVTDANGYGGTMVGTVVVR
jgi:plastocyanin